MRVLVYVLGFPPRIGGAERMVFELAKHLAQRGVDVIVATPDEPGASAFDAKQGFRILRFKLRSSSGMINRFIQKVHLAWTLERILAKTTPDCILCGQWDPCAYIARGICALNRDRYPYYLITHGMELLQLPSHRAGRWVKNGLRTLALRGARKIFSVSRYTRDRVVSLGASPEQVKVIPNGVEWIDSQDIRIPTQRNDGTEVLLTVSRLVPRKGHDTVIRSLPRIIQEVKGIVYRIVGDGPERKRLERLVRQLDLEKQVQFCGEVSEKEKERFLSECSIFVMPCRESATDFEGFGIALLEAMRYGKPVIAGNSGGVPDVIRNGETGILIEPDDETAWVRAIVGILKDPAQARRLGERGLSEVRNRFRWDMIAEKYLEEMTK